MLSHRLIHASAANLAAVIVQARSSIDIPSPGALPDNIQWMPPGLHHIVANQGGEPTEITVLVNEDGAVRMQSSFAAIMATARSGNGDVPFFDFNHDDAEASGWPQGFYWGGDDPVTGGIRAKVVWSDAGKAALLGRSYRRFSPSFLLTDDNQVKGSLVNMGGLVNRAAFTSIQPVVATPELVQAKFAGSATGAAILAKLPPELAGCDIVVRAKQISHSEGMSIEDSLIEAAQRDPYGYAVYRAHLMERPEPKAPEYRNQEDAVLASVPESLRAYPLIVQAKAIAKAEVVTLEDALISAAERDPAAYAAYARDLVGRHR